ncbi:MAG: hypothetical protein ABIR96_11520, partial [Bdellovibrionota bacterium]
MHPRSSDACAKFIVSGEHAVLAGAPCLVYPLKSARLHLELSSSPEFVAELNGRRLGTELSEKIFDAALLAGLERTSLDHSHLKIQTSIPLASGLGSSAALCVALARLLPSKPQDTDIFAAALKAEGLFHGRSSGADPAAVCAGHPILYRMSGRRADPFQAAANAPYAWVLRHSGTERATSAVISDLGAKDAAMPDLI